MAGMKRDVLPDLVVCVCGGPWVVVFARVSCPARPPETGRDVAGTHEGAAIRRRPPDPGASRP